MKIQDYNQFASQKFQGHSRGEYSFIKTLGITEISLENVPDELMEISDLNCTVEYNVKMLSTKEGIDSIEFSISLLELVVSIDKYPDGTEEIDLDIAPGQNIEIGRVKAYQLENPLPTYPTKIEIDMARSFNVSNFNVSVYFGNDY
jgi:hypothetical protein